MLTRQFIQSSLHFAIPQEYQQRLGESSGNGKHPLVKLEFTGQSSDTPVLSEASRLFNINTHIVSAQMDFSGGARFGLMLVELTGEPQRTQEAVRYFIENQIEAEVLGYV
jgi:D-methionine transport system ATP-binding protein